jgi:hypothetical protein
MIKMVLISLVFYLTACSSGPVPKGIIHPDKMEKVVNDIIQVDEFINNFLIKDTALNIKNKRSELYEKVFLLNKTNRKEFFTSFKYYQQHPDKQKVLFDSLYNKLNQTKPDTPKPGVPPSIK